MFAVIVHFSLRPDAMRGVREAAGRLLPLMRAEDGVVRFDALASDDGLTLVFDELWRDRDAWERHLAARPALVAALAREIAAAFAAPPALETYELLNS